MELQPVHAPNRSLSPVRTFLAEKWGSEHPQGAGSCAAGLPAVSTAAAHLGQGCPRREGWTRNGSKNSRVARRPGSLNQQYLRGAHERSRASYSWSPLESGLLPSLGGASTHSLAVAGRQRPRGRGSRPTRRRCSLIYLEHFSLTGLLVGVLLPALLSVVLALPLRPDFRGPPLELPATLSTFS